MTASQSVPPSVPQGVGQGVPQGADAPPHKDLWPGIAGVAAGALLIFGHILWMRTPDTEGLGAVRRVVAFYRDDGNLALAETGALVLLASALLFMFFLVALSRLAGNRSHLVLVGGTVFTVFLLVSAVAGNVFAITADRSEVFIVVPGTSLIAILLLEVAYAALIAAMIGAAVLLFAVWWVSHETRAVPAWLGWFGFVVAVLALAGPFSAWVLPLAFAVWMIAAGVVLILNARSARPEAVPPAQERRQGPGPQPH